MNNPPKKGEPGWLYVEEHIIDKEESFESVGRAIGMARQTVWRWSFDQERLNPAKVAQMAAFLKIHPRDFYSPPGRPSIDAMMDGAPEKAFKAVANLAKDLTSR